MAGKHLDLTTDFTPSSKQEGMLKELIADSEDFADVCVYLNGDYIGGRPNDR